MMIDSDVVYGAYVRAMMDPANVEDEELGFISMSRVEASVWSTIRLLYGEDCHDEYVEIYESI